MAHAINDRVTIYSDVISLTTDQLKNRVNGHSGLPEVSPTFVSPVTTPGNLWILVRPTPLSVTIVPILLLFMTHST